MPNSYFLNETNCKELNEKSDLHLHAFVVEKYLDSANHLYQTLILKDVNSGSHERVYFISDASSFYSSVCIGDTIIKEKNSLIINNITKNRFDTLKFNCSD